jgi:hypothetical protein
MGNKFTLRLMAQAKLINKGCGHTVTLPFTFKSISSQKKKNYGNSNISPMQKYNLQKIC